jgi:hypothetical protein
MVSDVEGTFCDKLEGTTSLFEWKKRKTTGYHRAVGLRVEI